MSFYLALALVYKHNFHRVLHKHESIDIMNESFTGKKITNDIATRVD